jgi:putative ABC transport system permease protein
LQSDQILIGEALVDKLGLKVGEQLRYGATTFTIGGVVSDEPDRLGEGFALGPVALVSLGRSA